MEAAKENGQMWGQGTVLSESRSGPRETKKETAVVGLVPGDVGKNPGSNPHMSPSAYKGKCHLKDSSDHIAL